MTEKCKNPTKVVILADFREKYVSESLIPGVEYIIKKGLNHENALNYIVQSPYFGKGTIFVLLSGLFSNVKWILNSVCLEEKCFSPYFILVSCNKHTSLIDKAKVLKEKFDKKDSKDDLILGEVMPLLNSKDIICTSRRKCQHPYAESTSHPLDINAEIDSYNEWIRNNNEFNEFHLNLNSSEMGWKGDKGGVLETIVPSEFQEKRKKDLMKLSYRLLIGPPKCLGMESRQSLNENKDSSFDEIIIVANAAYGRYLEPLKSPKVKLLINDDFNFGNIATIVGEHEFLTIGKNTLWVVVSGIFSVVQPYVNPECSPFCQIPILKVNPLQTYESPAERNNIVKDILLLTADIENNLKKVVKKNCSVMLAPLIPTSLMNLTNLNHVEIHLVSTRHEGLICIEGKHVSLVKSLYDTLATHWLGLSALSLQCQGIPDEGIAKYSSSTKGHHTEIIQSLSQTPHDLFSTWIKFMRLFLNNHLRNNNGREEYVDLDDPSILKPIQSNSMSIGPKCKNDLYRKFNHIVFIGPKSDCQYLEGKLCGASFIKENLGCLDRNNIKRVSKGLTVYPENSLFIVIFDENLFTEHVIDNCLYKIKGLESEIGVGNNNQEDPKRVINKLIKDYVWDVRITLDILKKTTPPNSAVILSPIKPSIAMWVNPSCKGSPMLQMLVKKKPQLLLLYGKYLNWVNLSKFLRTKWYQTLVTVYKKEKLDPLIPIKYMKQQNLFINIVTSPGIAMKLKDTYKERWSKYLMDMHSGFYEEPPQSSADISLDLPQQSRVRSDTFENSINELRQAVAQSRLERENQKALESFTTKRIDENTSLENLTITVTNNSATCDATNDESAHKESCSSTQIKKECCSSTQIKKESYSSPQIKKEPFSSSEYLASNNDCCCQEVAEEKNIKEEYILSTIKKEPHEFHDYPIQGKVYDDIEKVSSFSTLQHPVKLEKRSIAQMIGVKGHFQMGTCPLNSLFKLKNLDFELTALCPMSLWTLQDPSAIHNFCFTKSVFVHMEIRSSFLPSKLFSILGYGIKNILINIPSSCTLPNLNASTVMKRHSDTPSVNYKPKKTRIVCSKEEIFPGSASSIHHIFKDLLAESQEGQCRILKENVPLCVGSKSDIPSHNSSSVTSTKISLKRPLQDDVIEVPPEKMRSDNLNDNGRKQAKIRSHPLNSRPLPQKLSTEPIKLSTQQLLKSSTDNHRSSLQPPMSSSPQFRSEFQPTKKCIQQQSNRPSLASGVTSIPLIDLTSSKISTDDIPPKSKKLPHSAINTNKISRSPHRTSEKAITIEEREKEVLRVKVCGIPNTIPPKFIKDLSVACGCDMEPKKEGDDYFLTFNEKLSTHAFISTFNGKRLFNSKISAELCEGSLSGMNFPYEIDDLSKCLMYLVALYQSHLAKDISGKYRKGIDICTYKTQKCVNSDCKEQGLLCINYHSEADRRRVIRDGQGQYISAMCETIQRRLPCSRKEKCRFSHNEMEHKFHPLRYKKEECVMSATRGISCSEKELCCFVHPGTPDAFYHSSWRDTYVTGLDQSLDYLVGAVRMMRRVIYKTSVTALFITPSIEFLNFAVDVVSPIARINGVNILALKNETTAVKPNLAGMHLLAGTPNTVWSALSQNPTPICPELKALIIDDITTIVTSCPLHLLMLGVLEAIKASLKNSEINQVAIGDREDDTILEASSNLLQTKWSHSTDKQDKTEMGKPLVGAAVSSNKRPLSESEVFPIVATKRKRTNLDSYILKDTSNFLCDNSEMMGTAKEKTARKEPLLQQRFEMNEKAIDDLLSRARQECTLAQTINERAKESLENQKTLDFLEKELEKEQKHSVKEALKHPNKEPEFEAEFSLYISKYQNLYGLRTDAKHFENMWRQFWKSYIIDKYEKELAKKKEELASNLRSQESLVPKLSSEDNIFSPISCSSPKSNCFHDNMAESKSDPMNHDGSGEILSLNPRIRSKADTVVFPASKFKNVDGYRQTHSDLTFSDSDLLRRRKARFSSFSENSLLTHLRPKVVERSTSISHDSEEITSTTLSSLMDVADLENRVEKGFLSIGDALCNSSHLSAGLQYVVASFDNSLSVTHNVKNVLQNEDIQILFLLVRDTLEYFSNTSKDEISSRVWKQRLDEWDVVLNLAPKCTID